MSFHIVSEGSGQAILFIHAGVADSRMWSHQMGMTGFRTVAYDQRGFGKTPTGREPYSDRGDAIAVLDHLDIDSAIVVGCSIGASTAMELAIENPERVDGLVLVGAYPSGWVPDGGFEDDPLEEEAEQAATAGDFDRVVEIDYLMWLVGHGRTEDEIDPTLKELFSSMDRIAVRSEADRDAAIQHRSWKINDRLDEVAAPTVVVCGAHDETVLIDAATYLADRLSDQPPLIVKGAAHLPSLEQPAAFNTALKSFTASI